MKSMKIRSLIVFLLLMVGLVSAQELDPCFGLSDDDCAFIGEASANGLGGAESYTIDFKIFFEAFDFPAGEDSINLGFGMDGTVDVLEGDGELLPINFSAEFDFSVTQGRTETEVAVEMILFDDKLYFTSSAMRNWQYIDFVEFMSDRDIANQFEDLADQMGDLDGLLGDLDEEDLAPLFELLTLPGLLNHERAGDDFTFTIDLMALQALNDDENEELRDVFIEGLSAADPTIAFVLPRIIEEMEVGTIEFVQSVNSDLNIVEAYQLNIEFVGALEGLSTNPPTTEMTFEMEIQFENFDEVDDIEEPQDAENMTELFIDLYKDGAGL